MRNFWRVFSYILLVMLVSVVMAILPSGSEVQTSEESEGVHFLNRNGFYDSLSFLEENAVTPVLRIETMESDGAKKRTVVKYPRARTNTSTFQSSLVALGFVPASAPEQVEGSNVILTRYADTNPPILSEEERQSSLFNQLLGPLLDFTLSDADIQLMKMVTASERLQLANEYLSDFGVELTPEGYNKFIASDYKERLQQVSDFFAEARVKADQEVIETFVEEYSKFPGIDE